MDGHTGFMGRRNASGGRSPFNRSQGDRPDRSGYRHGGDAQARRHNSGLQQTAHGVAGSSGAGPHTRDVGRPFSTCSGSAVDNSQEKIPYGRLRMKATAAPHELLLELTTDNSALRSLLMNYQLYREEPDFVEALLSVLCRALECQSAPQARTRLVEFLTGNGGAFLSRAVYERMLAGHNEPPEQAWPAVRKFLTVAEGVLRGAPEKGWRIVRPVLLEVLCLAGDRRASAAASETAAVASSWQVPEDGAELLRRVERLVQEARAKHTDAQMANCPQQISSCTGNQSSVTPPEDFRLLPIIPSSSDLEPARPFLRANKTEGSYDNVEHYLDVQFRLLREDFMAPLRNGVQQYIELQRLGKSTRGLTDINVYNGVTILSQVPHKDGVTYKVRFGTSESKHLMERLELGKSLMFGSLLCLSADNYKTIYTATVAEINPDMINQGELLVKFEGDLTDQIAALDYGSVKFTMVESAAYFESYRDVLEGLKEIDPSAFPFQRYIVDCSRADVRPPAYLPTRASCRYNLTCLDTAKNRIDTWKNPLRSVAILSPDAWPDAETLQLDESQLAALKLALTSEFSLIQGPPGTGKTFIGLKIVQVLLENQLKWKARQMPPTRPEVTIQKTPPILIMCYTNHALDQFLEGIMDHVSDGVVRVGSQSRSARMESVSIAKLRAQQPSQPQVARNRLEFLREKVSERRERSADLSCQVSEADTKLLTSRQLEHLIASRHRRQLLKYSADQMFADVDPDEMFAEVIREWLDIDKALYEKPQGGENVANNENKIPNGAAAAARKAQAPVTNQDGNKGEIIQECRSSDDDANDRDPDFRDGKYTKVSYRRRFNQRSLRRKLQGLKAMDREEENGVYNVWKLNPYDRWRLYATWLGRHLEQLRKQLACLSTDHDRDCSEIKELRMQCDIEIMRSAKVVGMTTTGAAKYRFIIQQIMPRVVVVEEAAEVLEAHIVTALSPGCEHLILIGDHMQLRPSTTAYELARDYKLEISLFERMLKNKVPFHRLSTQHRMRPEISVVMRRIYPDLIDHVKVKEYEDIKGMKHNAFLLAHNYNEDEEKETLSHRNHYEASFVVALYSYLLQQGYTSDQITIMTAYNGQVQLLQQMLRDSPISKASNVRVTSVDNYQGEENDIVLLSVVRSNLERQLGFTKSANRICVSLSRARKGLYVFGNFDMLSSRSQLWGKICGDMTKAGRLGSALELVCTIHGRTTTVRQASDFEQFAPDGGCSEECGIRLACGHKCSRKCHPFLSDHDEIKCQRPCPHQFEPCGHRCTRVCSAYCGDYCSIPVPRLLHCGHTETVPCGQPVHKYQCRQQCETVLACGHTCTAQCGQPFVGEWSSVETTSLKGCRHLVTCPEPCGATLLCGHACTGTCGGCAQGRLHMPCSQQCRRLLVCGHECEALCCDLCPPCQRPCETRCVHQKCSRQCSDPCVPCYKKCEWRCQHYVCTRLCHESCERPVCNRPCRRRVRCGQCGRWARCIGLCGELCPALCRSCAVPDRVPPFFGKKHDPAARYVVLDDCDHVVEVSSMDRWVDESRAAAASVAGDDSGGGSGSSSSSLFRTESSSGAGSSGSSSGSTGLATSTKPLVCPYCCTIVRKSSRYGVLLKDMQKNVEQVNALIRCSDIKIGRTLRDLRHQIESSGASWLRCEFSQLRTIDCRHLQVLKFRADCLTGIERLRNQFADVLPEFNDQAQELQRFVRDMRFDIGAQQQQDAQYELWRLDALALLSRARHRLEQLEAESGFGTAQLQSTSASSSSTPEAELRDAVTLASSLLDGKLNREKLQKFKQMAEPVLSKLCDEISSVTEKEIAAKGDGVSTNGIVATGTKQ